MVFDFILKNVLTVSVQGVEAVDYNGDKCRVFLEIVGFVAYYPASFHVLDVLNHNAHCTSTHCVFPCRSKGSFLRYTYLSNFHSSNSCYSLGISKTVFCLRMQTVWKEEGREMGIRTGDISDLLRSGRSTLFKMSLILSKLQTCIPLHHSGHPIVGGLFDGYTNNIIWPDHPRTGIGKCPLETCFLEIDNEEMSQKFDISLCCAMSEMGMDIQTIVFNCSKRKTFEINNFNDICSRYNVSNCHCLTEVWK